MALKRFLPGSLLPKKKEQGFHGAKNAQTRSLASREMTGGASRLVLKAAVSIVAFAFLLAPAALAQHGGHGGGGQAGSHPVGGGHVARGGHVAAPQAAVPNVATRANSQAPISGRPAGFPPRPIFIHRHLFVPPPFFRFHLGYRPLWWVNCGAYWTWEYGCGGWLPYYGPTLENYVTPIRYELPVYVYGQPERALVWLYLKDGTAYGVSDYWFVNEQVHFITFEQGGAKLVERVMGREELDLRKTVEVNTRRGFRVVMRDEPLEQYLRDHPDADAPLLEPPEKN